MSKEGKRRVFMDIVANKFPTDRKLTVQEMEYMAYCVDHIEWCYDNSDSSYEFLEYIYTGDFENGF